MFGFGARDVADGFEQSPMVEPVDPFEGGELDGLEVATGSTPVDNLRRLEIIDRVGQSVVVVVADAADRRLDADFGQALGVFYGYVLRSAIAVMS